MTISPSMLALSEPNLCESAPERAECRLLRDASELEAFAASWKELWREDANATPFQSPEWLIPWWREFQEPELRAAAVFVRPRLVAFLPFYIHQPQRALLLIGAGTSDYLDGVFSPQCSPDHIRLALAALSAQPGWDVLYATQLQPASPLLPALQRMPGFEAESYAGESCSRMPALPLSQLPAKIRRNAMYYRNRAARMGNLELHLADASDCLDAFETLVCLHTRRWRSRGEPGVLSDSRVLAWHRAAVPDLQRAGLLRFYSLRLNGETIAAAYALADPPSRPERRLYIYIPGHSIAHGDVRPGTVLTAMAMESAAAEGFRTVDLLRGEEDYKRLWHAQPFATHAVSLRSAPVASGASS